MAGSQSIAYRTVCQKSKPSLYPIACRRLDYTEWRGPEWENAHEAETQGREGDSDEAVVRTCYRRHVRVLVQYLVSCFSDALLPAHSIAISAMLIVSDSSDWALVSISSALSLIVLAIQS